MATPRGGTAGPAVAGTFPGCGLLLLILLLDGLCVVLVNTLFWLTCRESLPYVLHLAWYGGMGSVLWIGPPFFHPWVTSAALFAAWVLKPLLVLRLAEKTGADSVLLLAGLGSLVLALAPFLLSRFGQYIGP
jgi:hypothetical protein